MRTSAAKFRHRVTIQGNVPTVVSGGARVDNWVTVSGLESVPARITYSTAREFIAAQELQSEIVGKISVRYRSILENVNGSVRIIHNGKIFNAKGFIPDNDSGVEMLTAFVTQGVSNG